MAFLFILPTWPVEVWTSAMRKVAPRLDVRSWPDQMGDVADIDYAAAWLPPANVLKGLPNLKVIFSSAVFQFTTDMKNYNRKTNV